MSAFRAFIRQLQAAGSSPSGTVMFKGDKMWIMNDPPVLFGQVFQTGVVLIPPPTRDVVIHSVQLLKEARAAGKLPVQVPNIDPYDHEGNMTHLLERAREWGRKASGGKSNWHKHYLKYTEVVEQLDWYCTHFKIPRPPVLTQDQLDALQSHLMVMELASGSV